MAGALHGCGRKTYTNSPLFTTEWRSAKKSGSQLHLKWLKCDKMQHGKFRLYICQRQILVANILPQNMYISRQKLMQDGV
jgi:hypothetical protein